MRKTQIDIFQEFAKHIEYPMVMFEAESGTVLGINSEAEILLGSNPSVISITPGRVFTKNDFWEELHGRKSMIWHRIQLVADEKELLVSGLIHEMKAGETVVYVVLFERRADLNIGSMTLERIVNHAGIVALHMQRGENASRIDYISQNINRYGYTRAQLYESMVEYKDIICQEDVEKVQKHLADAVEKKLSDSMVECRLVTEQRELIPIRLLIHYGYNDYGNIQDYEILILDLSDEIRKERETGYLHSAIEKMKSVVLVKSYKNGERKLRYISKNASILGMNVDALRKGYRLTEDYIHPDDRDTVIDTIYQAVENGMTDYVQEYRMVRDDGKRIWVENEITVRSSSDGEAEISFLLTDITERKNLEQELLEANLGDEEALEECDDIMETVRETGEGQDVITQFQLMADAVGVNADFYGAMLDTEGGQLIRPVGPADNMGMFYDVFERPVFRESFAEVAERAKSKEVPQSTSFTIDNMSVNMVVSPVMANAKVIAYWVLADFGDKDLNVLNNVVQIHWKLANSVARCFCVDELVQGEVYQRKLLEIQMHREQMQRKTLEDVIATVAQHGPNSIGEVCQKVALHLGLTDIGVYLQDRKSGNMQSCYEWSRSGDDHAFFNRMAASASEYDSIKQYFVKDGVLVVDQASDNEPLKDMVIRTGMGAIMMTELKVRGVSRGYVVYSDTEPTRVFDSQTVQFGMIFANVAGRILSIDDKESQNDARHEGFLESYNHIRDAVFVKDNHTGDIIFANKAMDKLFGYSVVGMQAKDIVNDQIDQYRAMQGIRKRLIVGQKVTKWQCYMKELDQIMNIIEIHLDTLNGADYSLVILKKNKNKDKDKKKDS